MTRSEQDAPHWVADPRLAWTPTISARRPEGLDVTTLEERLARLTAQVRPGVVPAPVVADDDLHALLRATSRGDSGPVVCGLGAGRVVVSVDHAISDGLGLLAALTELTGVPLSSSARGVGARPTQHGFVGARARRLAEVAVSPPAVVPPTLRSSTTGDSFAHRSMHGVHGTASVVAAAAQVCAENLVPRRQRSRVRVAVGLSSVGGQAPLLRDDSALLRLDARSTGSVDAVREALRTQGVEPAPGDATYHRRPWLARLTVLAEGVLAPRLGSTVLVSHLGTVSDGLAEVAFYPVTGGGSGLAIGAIVQGGRTLLTARARGAQHGTDGLGRILDLVAARLR